MEHELRSHYFAVVNEVLLELTRLLDGMIYKYQSKPSVLLSKEQYKSYRGLYLVLLKDLDLVMRFEYPYKCVATISRVSSQLIRDPRVDLPYDDTKIRVLLARNMKTSMSTQWKLSHIFKEMEGIKSEKEAIEMFTLIQNMYEGQWLMPKLKDHKHIKLWYTNNIDKFHQYFTKHTFLQFIWTYERLFFFSWKEK